MSIRFGRDHLYLVWKNPETRQHHIVGKLEKNGDYHFQYGEDIESLVNQGFNLLSTFSDINKEYSSDILFPVFASRLPDRKRKDIDVILKKYDLEEYDEYQLLKRSGARLPIDNFEFIDPIFEDEQVLTREFFVAGPRHYLGCNGEDCSLVKNLEVGQELFLNPEPENQFDHNAIKLMDGCGRQIGYIPRYYCQAVLDYLNTGAVIKCTIISRTDEKHCDCCLRVKLTIKEKIKSL